jgi:hypothetical protein
LEERGGVRACHNPLATFRLREAREMNQHKTDLADVEHMNPGSSTSHGQIICRGSLEGKGNGSTDVLYNGDVIQRLSVGQTINVSIVPNTWEEYQPAAN